MEGERASEAREMSDGHRRESRRCQQEQKKKEIERTHVWACGGKWYLLN